MNTLYVDYRACSQQEPALEDTIEHYHCMHVQVSMNNFIQLLVTTQSVPANTALL